MEPDALEALVASLEQNNTAVLARLDEIDGRIDDFEVRANRPGGGNGRNGGDLSAEHNAIGAFVRNDDLEPLRAAMAVGSDPDGGYVVLPKMSETIRQQLRDGVAMRRLARVVGLDSGDAFEEPVELDQDSEATWAGEKTARPETESHDLGVDRWPLREIYANVKVTQALLDLSFINIGAWIESKITDKFARSEAAAFISGASQLKPRGLLTYETTTEADFVRPREKFQHTLSGHATAITSDAVRDLYWSLRAPYRNRGTWLMASATANSLDKLKSGDGDYIWRSGMTSGAPNTLLSRPVEFDETMPAIEAGTTPIVFADFNRAYTIVEKNGLKMLRDPFTDKPHVRFFAYRRVGGGGADFHAAKFLKIGTS